MKRQSIQRVMNGLAFALLAAALAPGGATPVSGRHNPAQANAGQEPRQLYWAFRPFRRTVPPTPKGAGWVRNPIDAFVLSCLEQKGLSPAPPAGRLRLLRRVYFDLIGLPPPPEEIARFAHDPRPDAYERLIDRLLESPQYGERWGRHWLDVVRYADTSGFETDDLYRSAWQYRDYVIRSFNADKPFHRFLQEQIAGDELWPNDPEAVAGSGLYCVGPALPESAMMGSQLEYEWLTDAADTTGAAFLGLTLGCARCHDHKYDPIPQKDYYALQAVFAASDRPYPETVRLHRIKGLNGLLSDSPVPKNLENDPRCTVRTEAETGFRLFHRQQALEVHRLGRGELSKPLEVVAPAFPSALRDAGDRSDLSRVPATERRAAFAKWLTAPENPLPVRVLVNRVWDWHFGQAIVRTPNDFGKMGEPPTHPELLDWLASDFADHGWDLKRLHRLILLSSAYRMESVATGPGLRVDPGNRLLWHYPRHRLEGEAIRDTMLACAGTLNPKPFGPAVVPPLNHEELAGLFNATNKWPVTKDTSEHNRRSVYLINRRGYVYPLLSVFDSPDVMVSCPRRMQTVVPTQALALLNSPLAREQSTVFARRLLAECGNRPEKAVSTAWLLAFGRPITPAETARTCAFLQKRAGAAPDRSSGSGSGPSAGAPATSAPESALAALCLALFNANEFVYVD
jgi:hypothetical protein